MTPPAARLKAVSKSFGQGRTLVRALQDVDLTVRAGELTLIEGPSGSGKTTLLHILGLLQRPDEGEIWIDERRMDGLPESSLPDERAENVALIFQGYNLLEALTAGDNVAVAGLLGGGRRRSTTGFTEPGFGQRRNLRAGLFQAGAAAGAAAGAYAGILARFGLADRANHLPCELSGGEKQRIAVARALACPGRLVLADEPTANVDWANAQEIVKHLVALAHEDGKAVVMVSHDSRLEPFADRIVGLLDGRIFSDRRRTDAPVTHSHHKEETPPSSGGKPQSEGTPAASPNARATGDERGASADTNSRAAGDDCGASAPRGPRPAARLRGWLAHHFRVAHRFSGGGADDSPIRTPAARRPEATAPFRRTAHRRGGHLLTWLCLLVLVLVGGVIAVRTLRTGRGIARDGRVSTAVRPASPYVAAAPALVEPGTQLVALRSERQGRIKTILKRAGDRIRKDEPLVVLDGATSQALVGLRQADLKFAEASLAQLKAWDRPEQRAKTQAGIDHAQALLDRAERELKRIRGLFERDAAPESELSEAIEEKRLAAASLEEAKQVGAISEAGPIAEEVRVAEARVDQAGAALRRAETELALRTIVSPLDGHVIYRHLEPGEVVDPESPVPILSLGNLDAIRLRAEVDEADIQLVRVGQRVEATAAAFADRTFTGTVVHLEPLMGRKTIRTERTTEQQDTKVREVLIELDGDAPPLPIDLQMTVRFLAAPTPTVRGPG